MDCQFASDAGCSGGVVLKDSSVSSRVKDADTRKTEFADIFDKSSAAIVPGRSPLFAEAGDRKRLVERAFATLSEEAQVSEKSDSEHQEKWNFKQAECRSVLSTTPRPSSTLAASVAFRNACAATRMKTLEEGRQLSLVLQQQSHTLRVEANKEQDVRKWNAVCAVYGTSERKLIRAAWETVSKLSFASCGSEEMSSKKESTCRVSAAKKLNVTGEETSGPAAASSRQSAPPREVHSKTAYSDGAATSPLFPHTRKSRSLQPSESPIGAADGASVRSTIQYRNCARTAENETAALPNRAPLTAGKTASELSRVGHLSVARRHLRLVPVHAPSGRGAGGEKRRSGTTPAKSRRALRAVKVAIIGAGMAGVSAACALRSAGVTCVTLFEARSRIGGRCCSASVHWQRCGAKPGGEINTCAVDGLAVSASPPEPSSVRFGLVPSSVQETERSTGRKERLSGYRCSSSGEVGGDGEREKASSCCLRREASFDSQAHSSDGGSSRCTRASNGAAAATRAATEAAVEACGASLSPSAKVVRQSVDIFTDVPAKMAGGVPDCNFVCTAGKVLSLPGSEGGSCIRAPASSASSASHVDRPLPRAESSIRSAFSPLCPPASESPLVTRTGDSDLQQSQAATEARSSLSAEWHTALKKEAATRATPPGQDESRESVASSCWKSLPAERAKHSLAGGGACSKGSRADHLVVDGIDLGASWIHGIDENPVYKVCLAKGLHPYGAAGGEDFCCGGGCCFHSATMPGVRCGVAGGVAAGYVAPPVDEALFDEATGQLADAAVDAWAYQTHQRHQVEAERDGGGNRDCKGERLNREREGREAVQSQAAAVDVFQKTEESTAVSRAGRKRCKSKEEGGYDTEEQAKRVRWMRQRKLLWMSLGSGLNQRLKEAVRGIKQRRQQEQQNGRVSFAKELNWEGASEQSYAVKGRKEGCLREEGKTVRDAINSFPERSEHRDQAGDSRVEDNDRIRTLETYFTLGSKVCGKTRGACFSTSQTHAGEGADPEPAPKGNSASLATGKIESGSCSLQYGVGEAARRQQQRTEQAETGHFEQKAAKEEESEQGDCVEGRLLMWHLNNIEYSAGADVEDLSMMCWDQDDLTAFQGQHVLIWEGYKAAVEVQARSLDIRLRQVVTGIQYSSAGVRLFFERGKQCSEVFDFCICTVPLGVLKASVEAYENKHPPTHSSCTVIENKSGGHSCQQAVFAEGRATAAGASVVPAQDAACQSATVPAASQRTLQPSEIRPHSNSASTTHEEECKVADSEKTMLAVAGDAEDLAGASASAATAAGGHSSQLTCSANRPNVYSSEPKEGARPDSNDLMSRALHSPRPALAGAEVELLELPAAAEQPHSPRMQDTVLRDSLRPLTAAVTAEPPTAPGGRTGDRKLVPLLSRAAPAAGTEACPLPVRTYAWAESLTRWAGSGLSDSARAGNAAVCSPTASPAGAACTFSAHGVPPGAAGASATDDPAGAVTACTPCRESTTGPAGRVTVDGGLLLSHLSAAASIGDQPDAGTANARGEESDDEPQDSLHDVPVKFNIPERLRPYLIGETGEDTYQETVSLSADAATAPSTGFDKRSHQASVDHRPAFAFPASKAAGGGFQENLPAAVPAAGSVDMAERRDCWAHREEQTDSQAVDGGKQHAHQAPRLNHEDTAAVPAAEAAARRPSASDTHEREEQQRVQRDERHACSGCEARGGVTDAAGERRKPHCGMLEDTELVTRDGIGVAGAAATSASITSDDVENAAAEGQSRQPGENSDTPQTPSLRLWRMLEKGRCSSTRGILQFDPPLPEWKRAAIKLVGMGNMNKIAFVFRRPFWLRSSPSSAATTQLHARSKKCGSAETCTSEQGTKQCPAAGAAQPKEEQHGEEQERSAAVTTRESTKIAIDTACPVRDKRIEEAPPAEFPAACTSRCAPAPTAGGWEDKREVTCTKDTDDPAESLPSPTKESSAPNPAAPKISRDTSGTAAPDTALNVEKDDGAVDASGMTRSSIADPGLTHGAHSCSPYSRNELLTGSGGSSKSSGFLCGGGGSSGRDAMLSDGSGTRGGSSASFSNGADSSVLASTKSCVEVCGCDSGVSTGRTRDDLRAFTGSLATEDGSSCSVYAGERRPVFCSHRLGSTEEESASSDAEHVQRPPTADASYVVCGNFAANGEDSARSTAVPVEATGNLQVSNKDVVLPATLFATILDPGIDTAGGTTEVSENVEDMTLDSSGKATCVDSGSPSLAAEASLAADKRVISSPSTDAAVELGKKMQQESNVLPAALPAAAGAEPPTADPVAGHNNSPRPADCLPLIRPASDSTGGGTSAHLSGNAGVTAGIAAAPVAESSNDNAAAAAALSGDACAAKGVDSALVSPVSAYLQSQRSTAGQVEARGAADFPVSATDAAARPGEAGTVAARPCTRQPVGKNGRQQLQKDCDPSFAATTEGEPEVGKRLRRGGGRGGERGGGRSGLLRRERRAPASSEAGILSGKTTPATGGWQVEAGVASGGKKARCTGAAAGCEAESSEKGMQAGMRMCCCGCGEWQHVPRQRGWASKEKGRYAQIVYLHPKPVILVLMPGSFSFKSERRPKAELVEEALEVLAKMHGKIEAPVAAFVSRWGKDPFARGSYSYLPPGTTGRDYDVLSYPVSDRLLFAGEHTMRPYPSTVHGACLSGKREAERVVEWVTGTLKRSSLFKWFHSEGDDQWFPMRVDEIETAPSYFEDIVEGPESTERREWFAGSITCGFCGEPQTLERPFIGCVSIPLPLSETLFCRAKKKAAGGPAHHAASQISSSSSATTRNNASSSSSSKSSSTIGNGFTGTGREAPGPEGQDEAVGEGGTATTPSGTSSASSRAESSSAPRPSSEHATGLSRLRVAVHEDCSYHSPMVVSNNEGSRWFNVGRAVARAAATLCCCCGKPGASVPCAAPTCLNAAHVPCAKRFLHWPRYRMGRFAYPLYCTAHQSLLPVSSRRSLSTKSCAAGPAATAATRKKLRRRPSGAAAHFTCCCCGNLYADSSGEEGSEGAAATSMPLSSSSSASESKRDKLKPTAAAGTSAPHRCPACISRKNDGDTRAKASLNDADVERARRTEQRNLTTQDAASTAAPFAAFSAAAAAAAASAAVTLCARIRDDLADFTLDRPAAHQQQQWRLQEQEQIRLHQQKQQLQEQQHGGNKVRRTAAAPDRRERLDEARKTEMHLHRVRSRIDSVDVDEDQLFIDALCQDPAWRQKDSSEHARFSSVNRYTCASGDETRVADVIAGLVDATRPLPPARPVVLSSRIRADEASRVRQLQPAQKLLNKDAQQSQQRPQQQQQTAAVLRQNCMLRQRLRSPQQHMGLLRDTRRSSGIVVPSCRQERAAGRDEGSEVTMGGSSAQHHSFIRQVQLVVEQLERVTSMQKSPATLQQQQLSKTATYSVQL